MEKASALALNTSRSIERSFTLMGTAITGATTAAIGALGYLIDRTQETAFEMQKLAQQTGVSMESFSKLAYAAKLAGMPIDQMAVISTRVAKSSFEAASGNKQAAAAYKMLGVSVADGNGKFKTADTLMVELAKSLNQYKDSTAKTGIETLLMGRSGAQAAELMNILANRFDEVSENAKKLGVIFGQDTAQQAQLLHDKFVNLQEVGLGLGVRLLTAVAPALDQLSQKVIDFVGKSENMAKIDALGHDLADGLLKVGDAFEFLVKHADAVKHILETLALIRLGGMFGPMIASAASATDFFAKLGIASLNLTGNMLGVARLGTTVTPALIGMGRAAMTEATFVKMLATEEGLASAASYTFAGALNALRAASLSVAGPMVALAGAVYEFQQATKSFSEYSEVQGKTGASWWEIQKAEAQEATKSVDAFGNALMMVLGLTSNATEEQFYRNVQQRVTRPPQGGSWLHDKIDMNNLPSKASNAGTQKDLGALPQVEKLDKLALKLTELRERAREATLALMNVGKSPDALLQSEIAERYNLFLAAQKVQLDALSPAARKKVQDEAYSAIATEINTTATKKYLDQLGDLRAGLSNTTTEHLAMAAAIGKSSTAMQDAIVKAETEAEMHKIYGADWQKDPHKVAHAQDIANDKREAINGANAESDARSLQSTQQQIDAQVRLNDAVFQGAEAKRRAAVASQEAAIRADFANRADTNTDAMNEQIRLVHIKSEAEQQATNLQRAASMDALSRYQDEIKSIRDAQSAALSLGKAIDQREILAANKEALNAYYQQIDKITLATGNAVDGLRVALDQMARDTESTAQSMFNFITQSISSLNDVLAKGMMLHGPDKGRQFRQDASNAFRGIGTNLAKQGLLKAESGVLSSLGFGGKPDGSNSKPFYVRVLGMLGNGLGAAGGAANSIMGNLGQKIGTGMPSWLSGTMKAFLPGFADGTDSMVPGMPAIVGEKGPEIFIPPSAGAIVPNHQLRDAFGEPGHTFNIDARGSNDPAQTVALIDAYMKKAAPQITKHTLQAGHDQKQRVPARRG